MKKLSVLIFVVLCVASLSPLNRSFAASAGGDRVELTVNRGDCLYNICKKYLDTSNRWHEIARINRLANPHLILPDTRLFVPVVYLKRTPLPGTVTYVLGEAGMQKERQGAWMPLKKGDVVAPGSRLRTGGESALEIAFADGSLLLLKADTEIGILKSEQAATSHLFRDLYLGVGRLISRIKEATGAASRFRVHTPSAIASARGTAFRVAVDTSQQTLTEVEERRVTVEAARQSVELTKGEGTVVEKGKPPLAPRRLLAPPAPADLQPVYNAPPQVAFSRVEGAAAYRALVTQDKEGQQPIRDKIVRAGESFRITGLDDGVYFLSAQSIDDLGLEGLSSETYPFRIRLNPLPPMTRAPQNGDKTKGKTQRFQWLSVGDAVAYRVQIARDREFRTIVRDKVDLANTEMTMALPDYGSYYFRVGSIAADGYQGAWSDALGFAMVPLPPAPTVDKADVGKDEIHLRSRNVGEAFTYRFQIAKDPAFRKILFDRKADKPEIAVKRPEESGIYYVRIAAIDRDGDAGPYSPPQNFEIKERIPFEWLGGSLGIVLLLVLVH